MYRSNHKGEIADEIDLFREFFQRNEEISKKDFERLATIWVKRYHFRMETGTKWSYQLENVPRKLERQNARRISNELINSLPISKMIRELEAIFPDKESFGLIEAVHWLVDGHLIKKLSYDKIKDIFGRIETEVTNIKEPEETISGIEEPITDDQFISEEVDIIDL